MYVPLSVSHCVSADARRLCWCRTLNSELSTARRFTGSPAARGSTRSSRSRSYPPTGTRGCSCLPGTGTRKRGRDRQLVSVVVQARQYRAGHATRQDCTRVFCFVIRVYNASLMQQYGQHCKAKNIPWLKPCISLEL